MLWLAYLLSFGVTKVPPETWPYRLERAESQSTLNSIYEPDLIAHVLCTRARLTPDSSAIQHICTCLEAAFTATGGAASMLRPAQASKRTTHRANSPRRTKFSVAASESQPQPPQNRKYQTLANSLHHAVRPARHQLLQAQIEHSRTLPHRLTCIADEPTAPHRSRGSCMMQSLAPNARKAASRYSCFEGRSGNGSTSFDFSMCNVRANRRRRQGGLLDALCANDSRI